MLEDNCVTEGLIFGRNEKSCPILSKGVEGLETAATQQGESLTHECLSGRPGAPHPREFSPYELKL